MVESKPTTHPDYKPGQCNIGQREVSVRKQFLKLFLPLTILLTVASFMWPSQLIIWISLVFCSFSSIVLYGEVRYRFCIIFGFFNLYNFEKLGNLNEVSHPMDKHKDRKKVLEVILVSMTIALLFSTLVHSIAAAIAKTT